MGDPKEDVIGKNEDSDSGDNFSFNSIASQDQDQDQESPADDDAHNQESDFEFGCVKPTSPTTDLNKSSPADVLFFNGRLLPHAFPSESVNNNIGTRIVGRSHGSSRTSSISSKDSLLSSRSNSRSSSCSSTGRPSSSENIEKRLLDSEASEEISARRLPITRNQINRSIRQQPQVSNQRWQFIAPAPFLTPTTSVPPRRKKNEHLVPEEMRSKKQVKNKNKNKKSSWFGPRFFRSFISTCRACHALEPSKRRSKFKENFC